MTRQRSGKAKGASSKWKVSKLSSREELDHALKKAGIIDGDSDLVDRRAPARARLGVAAESFGDTNQGELKRKKPKRMDQKDGSNNDSKKVQQKEQEACKSRDARLSHKTSVAEIDEEARSSAVPGGSSSSLKRKNKRNKKHQEEIPWQTVEVSDDAVFGFEQEGFCNLQELEANVITGPNGELIIQMDDGSTLAANHGNTNEDAEANTGGKDASAPQTKKKKKKQKKKKQKTKGQHEGGDEDSAVATSAENEEGKAVGSNDASPQPAPEGSGESSAKKGPTKKKAKEKKRKEGDKGVGKKGSTKEGGKSDSKAPPSRFDDLDMSEWIKYDLHSSIIKGLQALGFATPTPIQDACLVPAIRDFRDIVACAETGSGKTLAFGIPILQQILNLREKAAANGEEAEKGLKGLILCPTRELAIQVGNHLSAIGKHCRVRCVAIVGGMATSKQERLLNSMPEVVVGTPGRIWEFIASGNPCFNGFKRLRFLALDEADRMVEKGHFADLTNILQMLPLASVFDAKARNALAEEEEKRAQRAEENRLKRDAGENDANAVPNSKKKYAMARRDNKRSFTMTEDEFNDMDHEEDDEQEGAPNNDDDDDDDEDDDEERGDGENVDDEDEDDGDDDEEEEEDDIIGSMNEPASMFLNPDVADDLHSGEDSDDDEEGIKELEDQNAEDMRKIRAYVPDFKRQTFVFSATLMMDKGRTKKRKGSKKRQQDGSIHRVIKLCGLREKYFEVNLLEQTAQVASKLVEQRITCNASDKDMYLYYLIKKHPGRTIVFVNSIDAIRRLLNLFRLLNVQPLGLFAQMQQRQRLKHLDRFRAQQNAVLFATDVAARGLDIQGIEHVVHYHLPRHTNIYIHRSGRTARANKSGLSIILEGPEDLRAYKRIVKDLNKSEELPFFPVDPAYLKPIQKRIKVAAKLEKLERLRSKASRENDWYIKAAEEAGLELDDGILKEEDTDKSRKQKQQMKSLRAELKQLLAQPVLSVLAKKDAYVSRGRNRRRELTLEGTDDF